jgi:hypothetical protein
LDDEIIEKACGSVVKIGEAAHTKDLFHCLKRGRSIHTPMLHQMAMRKRGNQQ